MPRLSGVWLVYNKVAGLVRLSGVSLVYDKVAGLVRLWGLWLNLLKSFVFAVYGWCMYKLRGWYVYPVYGLIC